MSTAGTEPRSPASGQAGAWAGYPRVGLLTAVPDIHASTRWRRHWPTEALQRAGYDVRDLSGDWPVAHELWEWLKDQARPGDLVVVQRSVGAPQEAVSVIFEFLRRRGLRVLLDIDDLSWEAEALAATSAALEARGVTLGGLAPFAPSIRP